MKYIELYNIANETSVTSVELYFGVALGIILLILIGAIMKIPLKNFKLIVPFIIVLTVMLALFALSGNKTKKDVLLEALKSDRCEVVEGIVSNFKPLLTAGHGIESFDVANKHFEYTEYSFEAGYKQTAFSGGKIHDGLQVKIWSYQGRIARIEIAQ